MPRRFWADMRGFHSKARRGSQLHMPGTTDCMLIHRQKLAYILTTRNVRHGGRLHDLVCGLEECQRI